MPKPKKRFCGFAMTADLCDRIAVAAKRQGRSFSEEVELRLRPFYYAGERDNG